MTSVTDSARDGRLEMIRDWLTSELRLTAPAVAPASADASFRRYFRVHAGAGTFIVMDAPPEREDVEPFVRAARDLAAMGVRVPDVLEADRQRGFLLLTDLGSMHYLSALQERTRAPELYRAATDALLKIQVNGGEAAASLPAYGVGLLDRDVQLLPEWFVGRHLGRTLAPEERDLIERVSAQVIGAALEQPQVYVHRDYHSRNLMVLPSGEPGIIDFQDAIRGAVTYDLVSLFKDCYIEWPRERLLEWFEDYRQQLIRAGVLRAVRPADFVRWCDLTALQRHLKVLGIFARLWYRDGKRDYLRDLPLVLRYVLDTTAAYGELAELDRWLRTTIAPGFAAAQARVLGS
jgi:hypothetical protein